MMSKLKAKITLFPNLIIEREFADIDELRIFYCNDVLKTKKVISYVTELDNKAIEFPEFCDQILQVRDLAVDNNEIYDIPDNLKLKF